MNRKQSFILFGGAFLIGLAFAWAFHTPRTLAAGQIQPFTQIEADTQICPLSDKQQEDSIQKFAEMMPIFTHPRCINCHGAINPFAPNTTHVGGRIGTKFKEIIRHDDVLGKDLTIVVIDEDEFFTRCKDCHSAFTGSKGWSMPRPQLWFIGKTSTQLCKQMKLNFSPLSSFVNHLDKDDLLFIQEAFRGTRGLDENGKAAYLNETGKEFKPEPPPISHEAFVAQGRAWVEALGPGAAENSKGGYTCGCEPHHYALNGNFDMVFPGFNQIPYVKGQADLHIPIQFNDNDSFSGETKVDVNSKGTLSSASMTCSETWPIQGMTWKASGNIDDYGEMHMTLTVKIPPSDLTTVCTVAGITTTITDHGNESGLSIDFDGFVQVGQTFSVESGPFTVQLMIVEEGR